jgi:tellurite resistance protein
MFLNQLSEKEKEAFISLSVHVSNSNGIFADEEKVMIQEYSKEMEIPEFDTNEAKSIDEIINVFKSSELHIKKVIMLEVLGLVYSDGFYDAEEENFIKKFSNDIGLADEIVESLTVAIKIYSDALKEVCGAVE